MKGFRPARVSSFIKEELSDIIKYKMKYLDTDAIVSISGVKVSGDLKHAKVYISIFSEDREEEKRVMELLKDNVPFLRKELGHRMRIRFIPELHLELDKSMEYGAKIEKILDELRSKEHWDD